MKKKYLKPRCETVVVKTTNIICISPAFQFLPEPEEDPDYDKWVSDPWNGATEEDW